MTASQDLKLQVLIQRLQQLSVDKEYALRLIQTVHDDFAHHTANLTLALEQLRASELQTQKGLAEVRRFLESSASAGMERS